MSVLRASNGCSKRFHGLLDGNIPMHCIDYLHSPRYVYSYCYILAYGIANQNRHCLPSNHNYIYRTLSAATVSYDSSYGKLQQ